MFDFQFSFNNAYSIQGLPRHQCKTINHWKVTLSKQQTRAKGEKILGETGVKSDNDVFPDESHFKRNKMCVGVNLVIPVPGGII